MLKWRAKYILCACLVLSLFLAQQLSAQGEQAQGDHWAQTDLWELTARGIISKRDLDPEKFITRAEFTEMIVTSLGLKQEALGLQGAPSTFQDVPAKHPLKGYINIGLERNLVGGYTSEIFRPDEELRRDQMIILLLREMGLGEIKAEKEHLTFKDVGEIPDYALPSISQGVKLGLVAGFADHTFRPDERVTLAQGAAFITRWLELMGDRYDYTGEFVEVDPKENSITMKINKNTISFPMDAQKEILKKGKQASWSELDKDQQVSVKLNISGKVVFVHQKEIELEKVATTFNARRLPRADATQSLPRVAGLFNPQVPLDQESIANSLETTKAEINIPSLVSTTKSDGKGQIIAIIDTGVDPSHPDLRVTTDGKPKLIEWVDFTLEGLVNISAAPKGAESHLKLGGQEFRIGDIPSRSNVYRMGYLNLNDILPLELVNKANPQKIAVLVTDATIRGVYDTVYIDTNSNQSFINEKALKLFKKDQSYTTLDYQGAELALAVVDISASGSYVQFANDISGHGTHVAGIIGANGEIQGVAPGAQIMVLKAVDRDGYAHPANIMEAVRYAAINGAHIINISLGQYQETTPGQSELSQLVNEVVDRYDAVVVAAAGNIGPGVNTVASPADADKTISVGAFVSPRMWQVDYNYRVPQDSLYYFSSAGPRRDGAWFPTIIAPGSAVSTVPRWMGHDYLLTEGTSMAAPHVSGVVAHLLENATKQGINTTPALIKRAIEESTRNIEYLNNMEDGHGVVNAYGAWQKLQELKEERKIKVDIFNPEYGTGTGIFAREYLPARLTLKLDNTDTKNYLLEWTASEEWIKLELKTSHIMARGKREIPISFDLPQESGLYSGVLVGNDKRYPGIEVEVPINIIVGEKFQDKKSRIYTQMGSLKPAQLARYFVNVPQGTINLKANLEIFPDTSGNYQGRGRMHLIDPFGYEESMSGYAGEGPQPLLRKSKVNAINYFPQPGTWEVVVYSSAALSDYSINETKYQLSIELGDTLEMKDNIKPDLNLIISPIPTKALRKPQGTVIINIWDQNNKKPYNGALEVNNKLYQIQNGRLEYQAEKIKENMKINFTLLK